MSKSNTEVDQEDLEAEIEAAAYMFALHTRGGGGWALGLAVASCAYRAPVGGDPFREHEMGGKTPASVFAKKAGTTTDRVLGYLDAWERAAQGVNKAGGKTMKIVNPASDLTPLDWDDIEQLPEGYEWADYYKSISGGRPRDSKPADAAKIIRDKGADDVIEQLTDDEVEDLVEAAARKRQAPTQRGIVKERSARLPAPPFTAAPPSVNVDPLSERIMDFQAKVYRLHALLVDMGIDVHDCPEAAAGEADRLDREADLIKMIAASARGISDQDLIALLEVES